MLTNGEVAVRLRLVVVVVVCGGCAGQWRQRTSSSTAAASSAPWGTRDDAVAPVAHRIQDVLARSHRSEP